MTADNLLTEWSRLFMASLADAGITATGVPVAVRCATRVAVAPSGRRRGVAGLRRAR